MTAIDRLPAHHDTGVTVYPGDASGERGLLRRLSFALVLFTEYLRRTASAIESPDGHRTGPLRHPHRMSAPSEDKEMNVDIDLTVEIGQAGLLVVVQSDQLKAECARRGWSLTQLARRAGISYSDAPIGSSRQPRTASYSVETHEGTQRL